MSAVVQCDGPGCDQTRTENSAAGAAWLNASRGLARFDFHSAECLAAWAKLQTPNLGTTAAVDGR